MARIGNFGVKRESLDDVFGYFDEDIRVNPDLSELDIMDFMEKAGSVDEKDAAAAGEVKKFLRSLIHPEDFDTFWSLAHANRQRVADLMEISKVIIELVSGHPTSPPAGSSDGRLTIAPRLREDSYSRVMSKLDGRPDLQLAVVRAQEGRQQQVG